MAPRRVELLVGLAGAITGAAGAAIWGNSAGGILATAVLGGALGAGRSRPLAAWLAATLALLAMAPDGTSPVAAHLLAPAHAFCAGRWNPRWIGAAALVSLIGASQLGIMLHHGEVVVAFFTPVAAWIAGRALREHQQVADKLAERARELEQERDAHAQLSVRYERARIASELHDIVAHAISVMVVQASAGQRLAARDPQLTAEAFQAIASAAHQAEQDMGRLVALLGDQDAIGPAPDLSLVEKLVAHAARSGLEITLRLEGEREGLPAPLTQTAYHVIQEGLTNALRYAAGAAVSVLVRGEPGALIVEVENAPGGGEVALAGTGTGTGLQGLRERVGACGGTLKVGPTPHGGWRLAARLPRRVTTATT